jgi:hypothetical protein
MLPPPPVLAPPVGAADALELTVIVGVAVTTGVTVGVGAGGLEGDAGGLAGVVGVWQVQVGVGAGGV